MSGVNELIEVGYIGDNGQENGNYYSMLGLYRV